MSEVPHCPDCWRADGVVVREGRAYSYYCRRCDRVIHPDDVRDVAWIDMVSRAMFDDPEAVHENAVAEYSDACQCNWCDRGRPGLDDLSGPNGPQTTGGAA